MDGRRCRLTCSFPRACARRRTATAADVVDGRPPALTGSGGGVGVPGVDVELGVVVTMIVVASWWRWWWRRGGGGGESWVAAATTERQRCGRGGNCVGRGSRCWSVEAEMILCCGWWWLVVFSPSKTWCGQKNQQTDLGKWGHRFVSKNKKQICEDKKQKKRAN